MTGVQLDEPVNGLIRGVSFTILPVAIGDVDLRLLCVTAERVATLQRLEVLCALSPVAVGE